MGDDVRDRLAVDSQRDRLAGLHGVDHLPGAVAQVTNTNLHVRQRSTLLGRSPAFASLCRHYWWMVQSAEFEAEVMARRVDIHALRAEAQRLEGEGQDVWELGVTIPSGWLSALAEGLDCVMGGWQKGNADKFADSEDAAFDCAKLFERMRSLASAIRDVEPGGVYVVSARDREALFRGAAGALAIKEFELQRLSEYVDPRVLRFVAIEQRDAIARFFGVLWDLLDEAEAG